jgi:GT2 family glycosyltransferase
VVERENGGPPAARNTGIGLARAAHLALLDSDDVWLAGYLDSQIEMLRSTGADLVVSNGQWEEEDGQRLLLFDHPKWKLPDSITAMCAGAWILPSFSVMRSQVAKKLGFDETFRMCDDTEFMFRFHEAGYRCAFNPGILARYRTMSIGAPKLCNDRDRLELNCYRVWQHHSKKYPEALLRGPEFDREFGELLLRHGRAAEAYPHLRRLWQAKPFTPSAAWLYARASVARRGWSP